MVWLVKTEIKESGAHGKGIFAAEFIAKGTKVWAHSDDWVTYTQEKMEEISHGDPERMKIILWGGYHHDPTGVFVHYAGTPTTFSRSATFPTSTLHHRWHGVHEPLD
jgi:hypothetical protein